MGSVLLLPRHAARSTFNGHSRPRNRITQNELVPRTVGARPWSDPVIIEVAFGVINTALNARDEVVVMVNTGCGVQFALLHVSGRIADAGALGPFLMALVAGQAAGTG
jgi:hypothetical protein